MPLAFNLSFHFFFFNNKSYDLIWFDWNIPISEWGFCLFVVWMHFIVIFLSFLCMFLWYFSLVIVWYIYYVLFFTQWYLYSTRTYCLKAFLVRPISINLAKHQIWQEGWIKNFSALPSIMSLNSKKSTLIFVNI